MIVNPSCTSSAVLYCRYSSHAQRDVSIDQQINECRKFASHLGIEIVKIYDDRATTGTNDRRPGFQRMIREAERMDYKYVIVYSLDRFARDRYDSAVYKRQLKAYGKKVLSATENISDDPTGILMESLLEGLAEYYSKELSRKIHRGMTDNAEKCLANGSLPYGYRRGKDGRYEIVEEEAAVVREIYNRVLKHEKITEICRDLNYRGIKTKLGRQWGKSSFNKILSNERYTGTYIFGNIRKEGGIPVIIDRELFNAVQHEIKHKPNPRSSVSRRRNDDSVYLLTGKLFCGKCKSPMVGISGKGKAGTPYFYYTCQKHRMEKSCDKKPVRRDKIEQAIAEKILATMFTDEMIDAIVKNAVEHYNGQYGRATERKELIAELSSVTTALGNIMAAIEQGLLTATTKSRLMELEERQAFLKAQIAIIDQEYAEPLTEDDVRSVLQIYKNGDVNSKDFQETLFDAFLIRAYVYDDSLRIVFNTTQPENEIDIPFDIDLVSEDPGAKCLYSSTPLPTNTILHKTQFLCWRLCRYHLACVIKQKKQSIFDNALLLFFI